MTRMLSRAEKRFARTVVCGVAAALLMLGSPPAFAQSGRTIVGQVTEARSSLPVSGATIEP
jgi:hypothetical protein